MAKPIVHARSSAKKFGGDPGAYLAVHEFMDWSKCAHASVRHRVVFHTREGCALAAAVLGAACAGGLPTAALAEQHVVEDLGRVPALAEFLAALTAPVKWMTRPVLDADAHARGDVDRWSGSPADYRAVHEFVDAPGAAAGPLGRIVLHHAFGCFVAERRFGPSFVNSAGVEVHTRDVVERHVYREFGWIPDLSDWVRAVALRPWMAGARAGAPACTD
jgi:hypothetical protein